MMRIAVIAGIGKKREIGFQNDLLWRVKKDLANFKKVTWGHHILMGRKTYESIGRPLPGRTSIILSRQTTWDDHRIIRARSFQDGLDQAANRGEKKIFIIGGAQVYAEAIGMCHELYLSLFDDEQQADCHFPEYENFFSVDSESKYAAEGVSPAWTYQVLSRIPQNQAKGE